MKYMKWVSAVMLFIPLIATAQLHQTETVSTQVPFKFMIGDVMVPAGEISLQLADQKGWVLALCNRDASLSMYALAVPSEAKKAAKTSLVFRKYGDRYFLATLKIGDSRAVYEFRPGKLENEIRARNIMPTEEVLIAGTR